MAQFLLGNERVTRIFAKHDIDPSRYSGVIEEMRQLGPPTIRCVEFRGELYALEGSHRLKAAYALKLHPIIEVVEPDFPLSESDPFWEAARTALPAYSWARE